MGKSAKFFKRPSLKEKQRREQHRTSSRHDGFDEEELVRDNIVHRRRSGSYPTPSTIKAKPKKPEGHSASSSHLRRAHAPDLVELKRQAKEMKATIEAEKTKMGKHLRPASESERKKSVAFEQEEEEDDGDDDDGDGDDRKEEDVSEGPKRRQRSGRARKRYKVPPGEARTPAAAGIDYLAQFEGRKNFKI